MALVDVISWESNDREYCNRFPSDALKLGSQLVVHPAQTAFFVKGGQICDEFKAGTYTLKTENLPLLNKLINLPFGKQSPFKAEVWFVNQTVRLDLKWGTQQPILLEDPKYSIIIPVRAFGQYGIRISTPRTFLESLIGNMNVFSLESIDSYFKGKIISITSSVIAKRIAEDKISILDISLHLANISDYCRTEINTFFEKYGITLEDFSIMSINIPQEDPSFVRLKEAKATAARLSVLGRDFYQMERSYNVLDKAAGNPGVGSQFMGLGIGMGLGNIISGMAAQSINTNPQPMPPPVTQKETLYHLYLNGQQLGGMTISQIMQMKNSGMVSEDTLIWTAGMDTWKAIKDVPDLFSNCPPIIKK